MEMNQFKRAQYDKRKKEKRMESKTSVFYPKNFSKDFPFKLK